MQKRSFFLAVSFPKKAFVFPNNRISEARICRQCWLKKISRKRNTKQQKKKTGQRFPVKSNKELVARRPSISIKMLYTTFYNSIYILLVATMTFKGTLSVFQITFKVWCQQGDLRGQ